MKAFFHGHMETHNYYKPHSCHRLQANYSTTMLTSCGHVHGYESLQFSPPKSPLAVHPAAVMITCHQGPRDGAVMSLESAVAYLRGTGASCSVSLVGASPLPIWVLMARRSLGPRSRLAIVGMTADTGFGHNDTAVSRGALTHVAAVPTISSELSRCH